MKSKDLQAVLNSPYKDYFETAGASDVYLLSKSKANNFWDNAVEEKIDSFFKLPNDNWIVNSVSVKIGEWISAYNADEKKPVSQVLRKNIAWDESSTIWFLVNRDIAFQTTWNNFIELWDDFIAIEDDCPLILPNNPRKEGALIFSSIGHILKINGIKSV